MIYTDGMHLAASTLSELHEFAFSCEIGEDQFVSSKHPHYTLTSEQAAIVKTNGAKTVESDALLDHAAKTKMI